MKLIEFFAGAGGLSCGLELVGFKPVIANEISPVYAQTYKYNHPETELIVDDIRSICENNFLKKYKIKPKTIDLVAGGPPCQGFSVNAPVRSLDDQRNHLFKDYLRIAYEIQPKAILIENVPGMVSLGRGTVVNAIYKELDSMNYNVKHMILFAGHYGVPQMRFRTIFIAIRKDIKKAIEFPEPQYDAQARANFGGAKQLCFDLDPLFSITLLPFTKVNDALSDLPEIIPGEKNDELNYISKPQNDYQKYLRTKSKIIRNHYCSRLSQINLERLKHIPQGGSWRDIPIDLLPEGLKRARRSDHTKRYGRLHPEALCSTVLTKCDPHWGSFFHPYFERTLSVREAARIQSFPDTYYFTGSLTEQYEQVGNAVPPLLAQAIGKTIKKIIEV